MQDHDDIITNSQLQDPATNQEAESQETDTVIGDSTVKDPDELKTGDEPMRGVQKSYSKTLSDNAGEDSMKTLLKTKLPKE